MFKLVDNKIAFCARKVVNDKKNKYKILFHLIPSDNCTGVFHCMDTCYPPLPTFEKALRPCPSKFKKQQRQRCTWDL